VALSNQVLEHRQQVRVRLVQTSRVPSCHRGTQLLGPPGGGQGGDVAADRLDLRGPVQTAPRRDGACASDPNTATAGQPLLRDHHDRDNSHEHARRCVAQVVGSATYSSHSVIRPPPLSSASPESGMPGRPTARHHCGRSADPGPRVYDRTRVIMPHLENTLNRVGRGHPTVRRAPRLLIEVPADPARTATSPSGQADLT
jgi:hypothetical protein